MALVVGMRMSIPYAFTPATVTNTLDARAPMA
jgi:hypothetical protein